MLASNGSTENGFTMATSIHPNTRGVFVIAATPFTDSGEIDFASTDRMVEWWGEIGATGMTVLGIMGEAPKLDMAESIAFVDRCIKREKISLE